MLLRKSFADVLGNRIAHHWIGLRCLQLGDFLRRGQFAEQPIDRRVFRSGARAADRYRRQKNGEETGGGFHCGGYLSEHAPDSSGKRHLPNFAGAVTARNMRAFSFRLVLLLGLTIGCTGQGHAASCVWKVSGPEGGTLYLGGSIHALRSRDYPLPSAFNRAFDASSRLVFEIDTKALSASGKDLYKAGTYSGGDALRNHVDPRTYAYLRRVFDLMNVPEKKYAKYRPWFLVLLLTAPSLHGLSEDLGVEGFLAKQARTNAKPISGLETAREHLEVFSGLSDRQSEAMLLLTFIPDASGGGGASQMISAWRRGEVDTLTNMTLDGFREFPSLGDRLIGMRNRRWIPKIEGYLRSNQTYFVVPGAAHLGGTGGLLALLRARGWKIEQL
jgi:uncharacterized protein YbaP (TraB family)